MPLASKAVGVLDTGATGKILEKMPDAGQVGNARLIEGTGGVWMLEEHVDERAALEIRTPKPVVEDIEDRQQALLRIGCPTLDLGLQPTPGPQFLAALEKRQHEIL